jgi:hypothetical protein
MAGDLTREATMRRIINSTYRACPVTKLDHVNTQTFKNGIVILTYHVKQSDW